MFYFRRAFLLRVTYSSDICHKVVRIISLCFPVVVQHYDVYVEMEHVILGNDALLKCKIPSHLADFVTVAGWVDNEGSAIMVANGLGRGK
jgi:hypothetical protein